MPKDEAYSRVSDPERYRPLHRRADLLLQRLISVYDLRRADADALLPRGPERVVRLIPSAADAAPVSIGWTDFPGLVVRFGEHCHRAYPHCGCDACDEDPGELFADLERDLWAVTSGRFREWADGWQLDYPDGSHSFGERRGAVREWRPWPRLGDEPVGAQAVASAEPPRVASEFAVREHVAAFNAHDTARLLESCADDCVWVTGTDRVAGRAALADLFDDWLWSLDPSLSVESLVVEGSRVAAEMIERMTVDGEERTYSIAAFFTVRGGRIARAKVYREGLADV